MERHYWAGVWKGWNSKLNGIYQYINLIFGSNIYEISPPSTQTVDRAKKLFQLLEHRVRYPDQDFDWLQVDQILWTCRDLESLLSVPNKDGFNILQAVVVCNEPKYLDMLLAAGADLNKGNCSLPLHLACHLGNLAMVQYLLQHGADPHLERGMCYPHPHASLRHVPSRFHFLETDIYLCDSNHQHAVMFAIESDHVDVMEYLLQGRRRRDQYWPNSKLPIHYACRNGAIRCTRLLATLRPDQLNVYDDQGYTPFLLGVHWGKEFAELLEDLGSDIFAVHKISKNTALHELLSSPRFPPGLFELTNMILGMGLEQQINHQNASGNTCLHELVMLVNKEVFALHDTRATYAQGTVDSCIIETLKLLLQHNSDPHILNSSGVNVLHKLICNFEVIANNDGAGFALDAIPQREYYKADVGMLYTIMEVILAHGLSPNIPTTDGQYPLAMLLRMTLNMELTRLCDHMATLLQCFELLCKYGAKPSHSLRCHLTVVNILAKLGSKCLAQRNDYLKHVLSVFLKQVLVILFDAGLNGSYSSLLLKPRAEGASGNIMYEFAKLSHHIIWPADMNYIYDWVKLSLQCGADPDIEPHPAESIICQSQCSIFLKPKRSQPVNQFMYEIQDSQILLSEGYTEKLLTLFYNTMDHTALFQSLGSAKVMARYDPHRSPVQDFLNMVNSLDSQPRSLQLSCRVAIYKATGRKIKDKVPGLPLPKPLKAQLVLID